MSHRQNERASRFQVDIEHQVRSAAIAFRDNDVENSTAAVVRLWWTSRLRGRRFVQLLRQARDVTQARISMGAVELGEPGRRQAMPYFLSVLRRLVSDDLLTRSSKTRQRIRPSARGHGAFRPLPPQPPTPAPAGARFSDLERPKAASLIDMQRQ